MIGPSPNAHYFQPPFLAEELDIARGFAKLDRHGKFKKVTAFGNDVQSGGIRGLQRGEIQPGNIIVRFFDSTKSTEVSRLEWCGAWWIKERTLKELTAFGRQREWSLREAASRLLFVPPEWSDMGAFVRLSPAAVWHCFGGFGKWPSKGTPEKTKSNHGFASPSDYEGHKILDKHYGYAPTGGSGIPSAWQQYVPGTPSELSKLLWIRTGRVTELEQELRRA